MYSQIISDYEQFQIFYTKNKNYVRNLRPWC